MQIYIVDVVCLAWVFIDLTFVCWEGKDSTIHRGHFHQDFLKFGLNVFNDLLVSERCLTICFVWARSDGSAQLLRIVSNEMVQTVAIKAM